MAQPGSQNNGGSQPAELQLAELNHRSASPGSCDVGIFNPGLEDWKYIDKTTREDKKGVAFRCLLVCLADPSQYVKGEVGMRSEDMRPLNAAQTKFEDIKAFRMSLVKFQTGTAQEYLHTPQKFVVNLSTTKFDPIMQKFKVKSYQHNLL